VLLITGSVALSVFVGACMTLQNGEAPRPTEEDRGFKFSHATHAEQGMDDCSACHDLTSDNAYLLTAPAHDLCSICHEIDDTVEPPVGCDLCHTRDDNSVTIPPSRFSSEIIFDHAPHTDAGLECAACHTDLDDKVFTRPPDMASCMDCHGQTDPKLNECSVCHQEIRQDVIPQFRGKTRIAHDAPAIWERVHGQEARMDPQFCALCHEQEASCNDCHSRTPPQDHTLAWRNRTHGLHATWDRGSCAVCHEENFCIKCHENSTPSSHRGSWGAPLNRHCVSCHFPEEQSNCTVCHERIDHKQAMPSPHSFGVFPPNCAACHPGGLPHRAPHAMNSSVACVVCHQ
jgi:predicted CXXCH cytochrome family protein